MADLVRAPAAAQQKGHNEFGVLPEWNLDDLYAGPESPELKRDLYWSKTEAKAFEADYKGKLEGLAKAGRLYEAVERSEKLGDVTGRLSAYAYLRYALNTQDPARVKFLGDLSQAITDLATGLLFWELELNTIEDVGDVREEPCIVVERLAHRPERRRALLLVLVRQEVQRPLDRQDFAVDVELQR